MRIRGLAGTVAKAVLATLLLSVLSACDDKVEIDASSSPPRTPDKDDGVVYTRETDTIQPKAAVAANVGGTWSSLYNWPIIPIHTVLLPDGRILSYGTKKDGTQTAISDFDVWTPSIGFGPESHLTLPNPTGTDIFCSSQVILPNGEGAVAISGGDNWTGSATTNSGNSHSTYFNYNSNALSRRNDLNRKRWYSSSIVLPNGEVYVQGGSGGTDRPEVRQTNGTYRLLSGASTKSYDFQYPRNFVAPDGRVFGYDSNGKFYYVTTSGNGSLTTIATQLPSPYRGSDTSTAMFRPGRILHMGGSSVGGMVIDITRSQTPVLTNTPIMSSERHLHTASLLADGSVLVTGGSRVNNQLTGVNNIAERWDPRTNTWTQGSAGAVARLYHSVALLLPDATVFVGGGGAPGPLTNRNFEIYTPYYLYNAQGALAARPTIVTAPDQALVGRDFQVQFGNATGVSRVTLVKHGSVTHDFNMEQRFVDLAFESSGSQLTVQMPSRATDVPPGYYMLFVLDLKGVPSVAKTVWVPVAGATDPNAPAITVPTDQAGDGNAVSLPIAATDPNGANTRLFTATGLPPGLGIHRTTGAITGTPTLKGTFYPVVAVHDGVFTATANFAWTITALNAPPLVIDPVSPPAPTTVNGSPTYTASSNVSDAQYRWNFGDGTPTTAYSTSSSITHTFTSPGFYTITATATDSRGVEVSTQFVQIVHLPLTARAGVASSGLLAEVTSAGGNLRLWVVNPDNDSVSLLDGVTGARLAEIPVGASPRALAMAANGMIWVTSRGVNNMSIIDPVNIAVSRTVGVPRGVQPTSIVMSADGFKAFVVYGATGEVAKWDTTGYTPGKKTSVGPRPRGIAISGDGTTVYVSRFVTRPQPGESTGTMSGTLNGNPTGGEVVRLRASDLVSLGTTVLGHSARPDFESQGRGVPNYLGAAAISPDGSQAFVPSKQDNLYRGTLRDGSNLNFQNTVRAISSRITLATGLEDPDARIDHDNASMASAALFDPYGVILFVALETSREIAVIDAHRRSQLFRFDVGRAPNQLALSPNGRTLYVGNLMDRTVSAFDLTPLLDNGLREVATIGTWPAIGIEKLTAQVLKGKQLFYDARDPRLALDRYLSCASCHNDGDDDGRVWDLTGFGEGLRNTVALRGHTGAQGPLHWTGNFDEVQDFEGQIRSLSGGTGLMSNADFNTGTRSQPLGTAKAGISADLDALAAYVTSLNKFDMTPYRTTTNTLTAAAQAGKTVYMNAGCSSCHSGTAYTNSALGVRRNVGTIKPSSGQRLGGPLTDLDVPTLRDAWATPPYLHDGSAATIGDAIRAHNNVTVSDADLPNLVAFIQNIGREEPNPGP